MEKSHSLLPDRFNAFRGRVDKKQPREPSRNKSQLHMAVRRIRHPKAEEEEEENEEEQHDDNDATHHSNLTSISKEVDLFLSDIHNDFAGDLPDIPRSAIDSLISFLEKEILRIERGQHSEFPLLEAIDRISKLNSTLGRIPTCEPVMKRTTKVLQRAMVLLEEEFRSLLEDKRYVQDARDYPPDSVERLQRITATMIPAGFEKECCHVFSTVRHGILIAPLASIQGTTTTGEDIGWEEMEAKISKWVAAFRQAIGVSLPCERRLCEAIFSQNPAVSVSLFGNLAKGVIIQFLSFVETVTKTKWSIEKLYKFLDIYETTRDLMPEIANLFVTETEDGCFPSLLQEGIECELSTAKSKVVEAVLGIFSDLETSIRNDAGKTPIPGGGIHPLTCHVMNCLKNACDYGVTLAQIFQTSHEGRSNEEEEKTEDYVSPFAKKLMLIMELLDENLSCKSKMYKDPSMSYIFLMNNGRYIMQKLKEWPEIKELLGDVWCRKRSADVRQYHKNYQRETWGKVLGCLRDDGLQGPVTKAVVKEVKKHFKCFNTMFEDIHKTQRNWVVSDEQLRSELRVSVSAVVVPAYRSFLGKYRQCLGGGKSDHKYVKFGPDDVEKCIEDLFDGNPVSIPRRKT